MNHFHHKNKAITYLCMWDTVLIAFPSYIAIAIEVARPAISGLFSYSVEYE